MATLSRSSSGRKLRKTSTSDIDTLIQSATNLGLGDEVNKILNTTPKLSFLQRLSKGLGAFNPAEAILTGTEKGLGAGLIEYPKRILQGIGSALTGKDIGGEQRYFKDVAEKLGVENGIAKFGIGFIGDVLLDPTTYFGGAIARGIGAGAKVAGKVGLAGVSKVAPEVGLATKTSLEAFQDALGATFKAGYKTQEGVVGDVLTAMNKVDKAKAGLAESNLARLGTGILTKEQNQELFARLAGGRRVEYTIRQDFFKRIDDINKEIKPTIKNLEKTFQADKGLLATIKNIDDEIELLGKQETSELTKFFQEGKIVKQNIAQRGIKAGVPLAERLPKELFDIAQDIKTDKVYDTFKLDKLFEEGVLERNGFKSIKDFMDYVKRPAEIIPEKIVDKTAVGNIDRIIGLQKNFEKLLVKSESLSEIDKRSINDAYRFFEQKLADLATEKENIFENVYRVSGEVGRAKATGGATGLVKETLEQQLARTKKFGEAVSENPYSVYFPFIRKDSLQKFLYETNRAGIQVGSEGYKKVFRNLLTDENLEQDVAKAFFTRESQVVSDKITRDFLDGFVNKYGKSLESFKSIDEARNAGYSLLREKGVWGKELGYIPKWDAKFIQDMLSPEFKTIDTLAKATGFDAVTSLFKRGVTGLFAPFHVRNFVSGQIQNFETLGVQALNPKNIASGQKLAYNLVKGVKMNDKAMQMFADRFKFSSFYTNEFDMAQKAGQSLDQYQKLFSGARIGKTLKTGGLSAEAIPFKVGRAVGNYIELQQKATAYVTALGQGKSIPQALELAEKAGFDYRVLTKFESQILRRIVPFYSFTRKNIGLQLRTLGENPQRINQVIRSIENIGEQPTEEEKASLPDYIKESFGIKIGDSASGLKQYLSSLGTPIEQFAGLFKQNPILGAISQMNPLLKAPLEIGIGKDSFRQKDLKEVYDAREYSFLPKGLREALGVREVEKPTFKKVGDKLVKTGTRKEYIADPKQLLIMRSLFTSRGFSYLDQVFDGDIQGLWKFARLFSGLKPQQVDTEVTKAIQDKAQKRALEDLLIKMGAYRRFESTYQVK
jgi:hypothetical protein